jgi:hypothetical protein
MQDMTGLRPILDKLDVMAGGAHQSPGHIVVKCCPGRDGSP